MPRAAVLGHPIAHSLSPVLHTAAYAAMNRPDWTYTALDCDVDELAPLLAQRGEWAGFSCTMPLKRVALELADEADPLAAAVGAANTLLPRGDGWRAAMTDPAGVVAALAECAVKPSSVTVLGAGGTAQAVLAALPSLGLDSCVVLVRDHSRAQELLASAQRLQVRVSVELLAADASALTADLVVSTLPAGAADPLADHGWRPDQAILDVVYHPWPTPVAAAAATGGATVVSGARMLLHQAVEQVRLMTGQAAPVEAMRAALLAAAPGCGA